MSIIFFDCETTGLTRPAAAGLSAQPYITELCAIKMSDDLETEEGVYLQMFKVPVDVEKVQPGDKKSTFEITGISNAMLADKNPFSAHWKEIANFYFGVQTMVAHNVTYDRDCLKFELMRLNKTLNFPWPITHVCTVERTMKYKGHRLNLSALHEHLFGAKFEGAHRAEDDVRALIRCYKEIIKRETE